MKNVNQIENNNIENNNIENNNIENNKKTVRVGRLTFGLILICTGIVILLITVTNIDMIRYIIMLSPLIFISLGIEVILFSKNSNIKYDLLGIILTFLTLGAGWLFAGVNYAVNKVLYDDAVKEAVMQDVVQEESTHYFENEVNLLNVSDKNINVKVTESKSASQTVVYIKCNYNKRNRDNDVISELIDANNNEVQIDLDFENDNILFLDSSENCESIEISIVTNSKENVKIEGNFKIIK